MCIWHYQWDLIHDPERMAFAFLNDESESEMQVIPDPVCTQKKLEKFRRAYVYNDYSIFQEDGWPFAGHNAVDITLLDGTKYDKIKITYLNTVQFYPFKIDGVIKNDPFTGKNFIDYIYTNNTGGTSLSFSANASDQETLKKFGDYLFPSQDNFDNQMDNLRTAIGNSKDLDELLNLLTVLPLDEYSKLTTNQKISCIDVLSNLSWLTTDWTSCVNDENILLSLIKGIEGKSNQVLILDQLLKNNFIYTAIHSLSKSDMREFIFTISNYIYAVYPQPDLLMISNQQFMDRTGTHSKILQLNDGNIKDIYSSTNRPGYFVINVASKMGLTEESAYDFLLDPYEYIILEANMDFPEYELLEGDRVVIPAVMAHWILQEYNKDENIDDFIKIVDMGLSIATWGSYAVGKEIAKEGVKVTTSLAVEWALQAAILSLDPNVTYTEAIAEVDFQNVIWSGATAIISDQRHKAGLKCLRGFIKAGVENRDESIEEVLQNASLNCIVDALTYLMSKKVITDSGSLMNVLEKAFKNNTEGVINTLLDMGIDAKIILSISQKFVEKGLKESVKQYLKANGIIK